MLYPCQYQCELGITQSLSSGKKSVDATCTSYSNIPRNLPLRHFVDSHRSQSTALHRCIEEQKEKEVERASDQKKQWVFLVSRQAYSLVDLPGYLKMEDYPVASAVISYLDALEVVH